MKLSASADTSHPEIYKARSSSTGSQTDIQMTKHSSALDNLISKISNTHISSNISDQTNEKESSSKFDYSKGTHTQQTAIRGTSTHAQKSTIFGQSTHAPEKACRRSIAIVNEVNQDFYDDSVSNSYSLSTTNDEIVETDSSLKHLRPIKLDEKMRVFFG